MIEYPNPVEPVNPETILGYVNRNTGVIFEGETEMLTRLSDPYHYDNQGRIETFPGQKEGELEWLSFSDPGEWEEVKKTYRMTNPEPERTTVDLPNIVEPTPAKKSPTKKPAARKKPGAEFG